jgi:hypothetical protein
VGGALFDPDATGEVNDNNDDDDDEVVGFEVLSVV